VPLKALTSLTRGVTIYAVAQRAGVSIATVSRALREPGLVAAPTRARVEAAVTELNFTPSRLGRSLAEGRHAANGIVFPHLVGPYYAEVLLGYEEAAAELGRSVLILATRGRRDATTQVLDLAGRVDGLVVMGQTVPDDVVAGVVATGPPVVLLARPPVEHADMIRAENEATAVDLMGHLLAHGHRRFAFLGDPDGSPDVAGRYAGVSRALRAAGLRPPAPARCAFDVEAGYAAATRLLGRRQRPQAVVCANDEVALGVHLAAADAGLAIPADLAVTGWDDVMAARFVGLTTVRQPMRDLGATAARWLHERITERSGPHPIGPARRKVLPTQLTVRRSCGTHDDETR
jgi:LacI family transcriptional regulator